MNAEITILAIRQRSFEELCDDITKQLEEGLHGSGTATELKAQLNHSSSELLQVIDGHIRSTRVLDTRETLALLSETVRKRQRELALAITKKCEMPNGERPEESLMNSTMRDVIAATGYMREPKVPKFNGSSESWPTFRDLFLSEVHHRYPDDVTKLVYLQQFCVGSAKQTLGQWPPTGVNYKLAWDTLCTRYEDERAIKQAAANIITTLQPARGETSEDLRKLIDTTNNALRQLSAAGCPTGQWDELVISKWMECLPSSTYRKWKRHLRGRGETTYKELCDFVEVEARTCEEIERREQGGKSQGSGQRRDDRRNERRDDNRGERRNVDHRQRKREPRRDRRDERRSNGSSNQQRQESTSNQPRDRRRNYSPSFKKERDTKYEQDSKSERQPAVGNPFKREQKCVICNGSHPPWVCEQFRRMSRQQRKEEVIKRKLCDRCLKEHRIGECKSKFICRNCQKPHSSLLCDTNRQK